MTIGRLRTSGCKFVKNFNRNAFIGVSASALLYATIALAAETLYRWDDRPFTNFVTGGTDTGTVDGISVTASGTSAGSTSTTPQNGIFNTASVDGFTGILATTLNATTDNGSVSNTINISFSEPVYNLQFTVVDVDGGPAGAFNDQINLNSDAGPPNATTGSNLIYNSGTGIASAQGEFCSAAGGNVANCLINVTYPGPVNNISIQHIAADAAGTDPAFQVTAVDDFTFNTPPDATDNSNTIDEDNNVSGNLLTDNDGNGVDSDRQDAIGLLTIASINGTPVVAGGTTITLANGASLTVFPNGNYTFNTNGAYDDLTTGQTAIENFTYVVQDEEGLSNIDGTATDSEAVLAITITGDPDPSFTVAKDVDINNVTVLPTTLTYTITLENTGDTTLTGVTPVDTLTQNGIDTSISLSGPTGDTNGNNEQETTETWVYTGTHVVTQAQLDDANDLENNVSVTTSTTGATAQTANASTSISPSPSITVTKTASSEVNVPAGVSITYTYVVTNTGNQTINNITLADAHGGSGPTPVPSNETLTTDAGTTGDSTDTSINGSWDSLAPGDQVTFTASYIITQNDVDTLQ